MLSKIRFLIPPEIAHKLTIFFIKNNLIPYDIQELPRCLNTKFFNTTIRSPIGLAAGFDKNAQIIRQVLSFGFGFTEVGTVTKLPQYGNSKPRVFRFIDEEAIINSLGFNNKGVKFLIKQINTRLLNTCIFGINIGINKNTKDPINDYLELIKNIYGLSNYITINISSPNTVGLRNLQNKELLKPLLQKISETRKNIDYAESIPILLKISPDIDDNMKEDIVNLSIKYKIFGLIISNTTLSRDNDTLSKYKGGLSGKPLFKLSTQILKDMYKLSKGKLMLIGCGGVSTGADAYEKIKSGASLIQLYTAIIYKGFKVINNINLELSKLLERDGFTHINQAIGINNR